MAVDWVTVDEVYGSDRPLRIELESQRQAYVLVRGGGRVWSVAVPEVVAHLGPDAWQRLRAGQGAKGPRMYDWARVELVQEAPVGWRHWLLARRSLKDASALAYYRVFAPMATTLAVMVQIAGRRWLIEEAIETAKGEVGLDQYEVRRWTGWYRHITLALLAHAYLAVQRAEGQADPKG